MEQNTQNTRRRARVITSNLDPAQADEIRRIMTGDAPVFTGANSGPIPNTPQQPFTTSVQGGPPVNSKGDRIDRLNIEAIKQQFRDKGAAAVDPHINNDDDEDDDEHHAPLPRPNVNRRPIPNEEQAATPSPNSAPQFELGKQRVDTKVPTDDDDYTYHRLEFPSNHAFYDSEIFVRPFSTEDIIDLSPARKINPATETYDNTLMLDVFSRTVKNFDVRDMHLGDFRFLFYWIKLNSFTRTPLTVNFTSKYGNKNKLTIKKSDIKINTLDKADIEKIHEYMDRGFVYPTIREGEEMDRFIRSKPKEEREKIQYAFSYVQFIKGASLEEKVNKFRKLSPDDMVDILQFSKLLDSYGVAETVKVKDQHFEPKAALKTLKDELKLIEEIDINSINNAALLDVITTNKEELEKEIARIEHSLSSTGEAAPSSETIKFYIDLDNFFPETLNL